MAGRSLKSSAISSLFWKLFEQGGAAAITLIVQVVLARLLTPEEFGELAIMLVFVNIGNVIVQSGLNTSIIQAAEAGERDYSTVFWMSVGMSLVLYAAVFAAAPFVAGFYGMPAVVWPLRALCLVLVVNAYNAVQEAIVARGLEFHKTFNSTLAAMVVSGAVGVVSALMGAGIWALVIQQLVQQVTKCIVLAAQVSWKPAAVFDAALARQHLGFGWKLLASGLLDQGYQSLCDLIIGKVFTKADLGFVSQGKKYPQALGVVLDGAIQPVMLSAVSRVQEDAERVRSLARRGLKTSTYLVVPAMTLFAVAADPIVVLVLGEKWLPCVDFLRAYCFIYALLPIHTTNLQTLNGVGRSDLFLKLEVVKNVVGLVILGLAALLTRNLHAIVAGYMLTGLICTFINAFPNKRVIGYSYGAQVRDIAPAFLLSAVSAAAAWPVQVLALPPLAAIALQAVVMAAVYLGLSVLLKVEAFSYLWDTLQEIRMKGHM